MSPFNRNISPFPKTKTGWGGVGWGPAALLTVSDKAMHTNVNFLMWAAVTVLLVLTSLLLGLFCRGEKDSRDGALGRPRRTTRTTFKSISFLF